MPRFLKLLFCRLFILIPFVLPQLSGAQHLEDSLRGRIQASNGLKKAELCMELANHFLDREPDSSIYYGQVARSIGERIENKALVIRSYSVEGDAYQKKSDLGKSISVYLTGLEIAEKTGERSLEGTICNGIGVSYFYLNDLDKAENYFMRAAAAKAEAGDYKYYSFIAANLASLQIARQSFDKAIFTLQNAARELEQKNQYRYLPSIYNSLGAAYQSTGSDSCVYYYQKSLALSEKLNDPLSTMVSQQNLGDYYFLKKQYPKAIAYMKEAIKTNNQRPEDKFKPDMFDRLSALYDTIGDYRNAYYYKKLETEARQRLLSADKQRAIEELEIRYQTEKKEKELQLGRQQIEKAKKRQIILLFSALTIFLAAGFISYLVYLRRKNIRVREEEKLRLFENIVHDIRTPLTLISGPVKMMRQELPSNKNLDLLERNSEKLMRLVDELLDVSQLGKGNFKLHFTTGNPRDILERVVDAFLPEARSRHIFVRTSDEPAHVICTFPVNALEKILSNLVGNAVKYCPEGAEIVVNSSVNDGQLQIEVNDNGPAIPEKERSRIFERFFRGSNASEVAGTGIGLALVKELASLAGGSVTLESSSKGNRFTLMLPVIYPQKSAATEMQNDLPCMLVAEDDPDTADFTISVLREDFRIVHVTNGEQALEKISEELPDIVLSDVRMPLLDGLELLRRIRSNELTNHLPVVLFSAKNSEDDRLRALQHGAEAYIAKPFSPEELRLTITNLLTTVQRNREAYKNSVNSEHTFSERVESQHTYVNKVITCIMNHIDNAEYSVNELASELSVSRSQLHRKLVALTGFSTTAFIRMIRLEKAKDLLSRGEKTVTETAYACGFSSQSYFTRSFTEYFGKSPSHFVKNP